METCFPPEYRLAATVSVCQDLSYSSASALVNKKKEWGFEAISQQQLHFARQQYFHYPSHFCVVSYQKQKGSSRAAIPEGGAFLFGRVYKSAGGLGLKNARGGLLTRTPSEKSTSMYEYVLVDIACLHLPMATCLRCSRI